MLVCDIVIFVLKRDVKLQPTNQTKCVHYKVLTVRVLQLQQIRISNKDQLSLTKRRDALHHGERAANI